MAELWKRFYINNYIFEIIFSKSYGIYFFVFRAREALRQCLPDQLRDATFSVCLQDDKSTKHWLQLLIKNLELGAVPPTDPRQIGMSPLTS